MLRLIAILAVLLIAPLAAQAQGANPDFYNGLNTLNRISPMQNPEYEPADRVLGRKMLDSKNKVVGVVKDALLTTNGTVSALSIDFDRLRLGQEVYVNMREMNVQSARGSYQVSYNSKQIQDAYPQMLAGIESAAGPDSDTVSLKKLIGAPVRNADGTRIGTVESVLFGAEGQWAEAIQVSMSSGQLRGRTIALPFGLVQYQQLGNGVEARVTPDQQEAMVNYLRDARH